MSPWTLAVPWGAEASGTGRAGQDGVGRELGAQVAGQVDLAVGLHVEGQPQGVEVDLGLAGVEMRQPGGEAELHLAGERLQQRDADRARSGQELALDLDPARTLIGPMSPSGLRHGQPRPARQPMAREAPADQPGQLDVVQAAREHRLPVLRTGLAELERPLDRRVGAEPVAGIEERVEHAGRQGQAFHRPERQRGRPAARPAGRATRVSSQCVPAPGRSTRPWRRAGPRRGHPVGQADRRRGRVGEELARDLAGREPEVLATQVELARRGRHVDPLERERCPERCIKAPNWVRATPGPSARTRGFSRWSVNSRSAHWSRTSSARAISAELAAARLLLAQDDPAIDHFSRPRVVHLLQGHLEPELARQLDLDVADMPRAVDPPRHHGDPARRDDRRRRTGPASPGPGASGDSRGTILASRDCQVHRRAAMAP